MTENGGKSLCQVRMHDDKPCSREIWDQEEQKCIFHSSKADQKRELLLKELEKYIKEVESKDTIALYDFTRFVFCEISFVGKVFSKQADFSLTKFQKEADFSETEFQNVANFSGAKFQNKAAFSMAKFQNKADFSETEFQNVANFSGAKFRNEARFFWTEFRNEASFSGAEFQNEADFFGAKFQNEADFSRAEFQKEANFFGAKFQNEAVFSGAEFQNEAVFSGAEFQNEADFSKAEFQNEADFSKAEFSRFADFSAVGVKVQLKFSMTKFKEGDFRNIEAEEKAQIRFFETDLSHATFLETDLEKFTFRNVIWAARPGRHRLRKALYDEILSSPNAEQSIVEQRKRLSYEVNLESVENLYRQLKKKYEEDRNYPVAGDFHIGEMEMKRLKPLTKSRYGILLKLSVFLAAILKSLKNRHIPYKRKFKRFTTLGYKLAAWREDWVLTKLKRGVSLIAFYRYVSLYGENYILPVIWILGGVLVFSVIFMFSSLSTINTGSTYSSFNYDFHFSFVSNFSQFLKDWWSSLVYTLQVFSLQRWTAYSPQNLWGHFWAVLARVYSPVMIALFLLALRRRFKR